MIKKISLSIIVFVLFIAWTDNSLLNTPVCTAGKEQKRPKLIADGSGGAVLVWEDSRNGTDYDIYAQRIDSEGKPMWRRGGIAVSTAIGSQRNPKIVMDGTGSFVITWFDRRNGKNNDIYAQRVSPEGRRRWTSDGITVCSAQNDQYDPVPVSDGLTGTVIVWQDRRNENDYDIYAQHIDRAGNTKWKESGLPICRVSGEQDNHQVVSDKRGNIVVTWQDRRNGNDYDIYAQRIDQQGTVKWAANGTPVSNVKYDQRLPRMIAGGNGNVIMVWQDKRNGSDYDIYAQRIDAAGKSQWTQNGIAVCKIANNQYEPRPASDGNGGVVITWQDYRKGADCTFDAFDQHDNTKADLCEEKQLNDWNIYAQHIDISGRAKWTANGITISSSNVDQLKPQPAYDGKGGTIITWRSADKENDHNIYAQRIDTNGARKWSQNGVAVSTAPGDQVDPLMVADGSGGVIVAWYDKRKGNSFDIYVQKVCLTGKIGTCPTETNQ